MYVQVALNIPADRLFTYVVPDKLLSKARIGKRVFVPFGSRKRTGFIVAEASSCDREAVKSISEILDDEPLFDGEDLKFYQWIADYFIYPLGKTLAELIPSGSEKKDVQWVMPAAESGDATPSPAEQKILDIVGAHPQGLALNDLIRRTGLKNAASAVRSLQIAGCVRITARDKRPLSIRTQKIIRLAENAPDPLKLTSRQQTVADYLKNAGPTELRELMAATNTTAAVMKRLLEKTVVTVSDAEVIRKASLTSPLAPPRNDFELNGEQQEALAAICRFADDKAFHPVLLHGVTGSGKTEVYLSAIDHVLKTGGAAIYLVPEIALTPQLISRITGRFDPDKIAVMHSGIAESVRYDQWRQIRRGRINLVIGARSALFAPLPHLKLIIVDEEHDASYKQDERLCYHARDLAVVKAKFAGAACVLGSATPGVRTFYNARSKKYAHVALAKRVNNKPLPRIDIIDMKTQKEMHGKAPILSDALTLAITDVLARREQALLFLNKRGFDTFLVCGDCGYHFTCPNCAVALKSHLAENLVKCHYCDYTQKAMPLCPKCRGSRILNYGAGTQKLEKELAGLFPGARICRMDSDTTARKGAQERILAGLAQKDIDILVGTQMITKGHDFPAITLVGVISADTALNMPDFRAAEKTFQMLTQVAGRGGRGSAPGRVIIQTFNPEHYALKHARRHDYQSFYEEEIEFRKALAYPPYSRIINLRLSSANMNVLSRTAEELGQDAKALSARRGGAIEIIGPAPSPLSKIRGEHRYQMLIKGKDGNLMHRIAAELLKKHATSTVKITIDVDPENFM
ncbi:MAG: primosomal protein N' [Deltaproteobacteria bacterium]|nr:primosomal protein N' [Deltaproteobacteria bacterium]